ncbi:hypothetical protein UYO_1707 [Lachnospiraceae bacterium JC7]|nr:hypothetical protein UYO_1707 [Lachnospiraceae bacterium JC7]
MKKLGVLLATTVLTVSASVSAFAYHRYSSCDEGNYSRRICNDYVCDDYSVYGANCPDNYGACYEDYGHRRGSYRINGCYRGC